jgi:hypothetical protein
MNREQFNLIQTRRDFFRKCAGGIGIFALADLLTSDGLTAASKLPAINPLAPKPPHFAPKAKHVIFMFMEGGPSQFELFDEKPALEKYNGQSLPPSLTKDLKLAFIKPTASSYSRIWVHAPMTSAWCAPCTRTPLIITRVNCCCLQGTRSLGVPPWGPGPFMVWAASHKTCLALWF